MSPKNIYQKLLKRPFLRKKLRKMRAVLQGVAGYSDPHYDLVAIANSCPSALFLDIGCHHGDTLLRFFESGLRTPVVAFDPFPKTSKWLEKRFWDTGISRLLRLQYPIATEKRTSL
jgi:hypothetical protein